MYYGPPLCHYHPLPLVDSATSSSYLFPHIPTCPLSCVHHIPSPLYTCMCVFIYSWLSSFSTSSLCYVENPRFVRLSKHSTVFLPPLRASLSSVHVHDIVFTITSIIPASICIGFSNILWFLQVLNITGGRLIRCICCKGLGPIIDDFLWAEFKGKAEGRWKKWLPLNKTEIWAYRTL